ncbi:MAG: 50S ribosomal protein L35 [Deltaproteobacteria bacterium]|nr:50S ribosomal protein L35 [Deltaproteobacteria bacterium]
MPKMKSHRGASKRFSRTGSGKLRRNKANRNHILTNKSTKQKRQFRGSEEIAANDVPRVERLLPYS